MMSSMNTVPQRANSSLVVGSESVVKYFAAIPYWPDATPMVIARWVLPVTTSPYKTRSLGVVNEIQTDLLVSSLIRGEPDAGPP